MNVRAFWYRVHSWPRRCRWPLKGGILFVAVLVTLYPKIWLLPVWVGRLRHLDQVVDANHPQLAELEEQFLAQVEGEPELPALRGPIEELVNRRVPYAYDWKTWGVVDYLPTTAEVFALGREDCDGRAVVAASLLRRLGYEAWLVTDLMHTWVMARDPAAPEQPAVELMSPGKGEKTLTGGAERTRLKLSWATARNLARASAFGIAVFPLERELVILAAVIVTAMQPRSSRRRRIGGCAALVLALVLLRWAGAVHEQEIASWCLWWGGIGAAVGGWLLLVVKAANGRSPSPAPR